MRIIFSWILGLSFFFCPLFAKPSYFETSKQMLVVSTKDWSSVQGTLQIFEKTLNESSWHAIGHAMPIVIGAKGIAWGKGLHDDNLVGEGEPLKKEGDLKGVLGVFPLGTVFGHTRKEYVEAMNMPYLELHPGIEGVDDPSSKYYNQIVNRANVSEVDWKSSEKMDEISLYLRGVVIGHNMPVSDPTCGSQIFLHIWRSSNSGTGGCTALSYANLKKIIQRLDQEKHPILVQFPESHRHLLVPPDLF